jgi:hypothetical protein
LTVCPVHDRFTTLEAPLHHRSGDGIALNTVSMEKQVLNQFIFEN